MQRTGENVLIVDAHLDLSHNAVHGREVLKPAREQNADADGIPSVGLPDLRAGGVDLICATIFCAPDSPRERGYRSADEAHQMAVDQLDWYHRQFEAGQLRPIAERSALNLFSPAAARPSAILLLEGADPIRSLDEARQFFDRGVRIVGLAWKQTRYAGGTGAPGPLSPEGVELVREFDRLGIIHDASHLAEQSFWQLLEISGGKVMASHSNCRAFVPTDRQLSDDMIRAIVSRAGVIGINFYDRFLVPPDEYGRRRATLADVVRHVRHVCDLAGGHANIGIGTDMDGGLGREQIPIEIESSADLPRVADALSGASFGDEAVRAIMGENWRQFFAAALP